MEQNIDKRSLGRRGEDAAANFLIGNGHSIIFRNKHLGHLEIDIISLDSGGLHFVEVKTRRWTCQAPPQENVGYFKQRRLVRAANAFLNSPSFPPTGMVECHFDIIAVTFTNDGSFNIDFFPDAFIPISC